MELVYSLYNSSACGMYKKVLTQGRPYTVQCTLYSIRMFINNLNISESRFSIF